MVCGILENCAVQMALRVFACIRRWNFPNLPFTAHLRLTGNAAILKRPVKTLALRIAGPIFSVHLRRWCFCRYNIYLNQNRSPRASYSNGATGGGAQGQGSAARLSNTEKIKVLVKEYGTVAVVFHTIISLFSLGTCYLLVSK